MNEKTPLKQVLLVEDSLLSQRITSGILKDVCQVTCVETTQAALSALENTRFGLIIADIMLKEETALGLIKHIRKQSNPMDLPICVLTSTLDDRTLNKFLLAGVNDAYRKPVFPQTLVDAVNRLLTAPYIRDRVAGTPVPVQCLYWEAHNQVFAFNPDTVQVAIGKTKAEAMTRLSELVQKSLKIGPELDLVIETHRTELYLQLD